MVWFNKQLNGLHSNVAEDRAGLERPFLVELHFCVKFSPLERRLFGVYLHLVTYFFRKFVLKKFQ